MLLSNSSGFDLYAHSSMYYYFDTVTYTNYNFFDFLIFPRYLFLSYLYEFMGRIGIPLGYFVIFMLLFPIYFIINYALKEAAGRNKIGQVHSLYVFILFICVNLSFFYSATSIIFLFLFAYLISSKKIFLVGIFFHPMGFIIYLCLVPFKGLKYIFLLFYVILIYLVVTYIETHYINFFTSGKIQTSPIDLTLFEIYAKRIFNKINEVYNLIYLLIMYLVIKRIKVDFYLKYSYLAFLLFSFSLVISIYMYNKFYPTALKYFFSNEYNYTMDATWADFGTKDIAVKYGTMYKSRYENGVGLNEYNKK